MIAARIQNCTLRAHGEMITARKRSSSVNRPSIKFKYHPLCIDHFQCYKAILLTRENKTDKETYISKLEDLVQKSLKSGLTITMVNQTVKNAIHKFTLDQGKFILFHHTVLYMHIY